MKTFCVSIACGCSYLCGIGVLFNKLFFILYLMVIVSICLAIDD